MLQSGRQARHAAFTSIEATELSAPKAPSDEISLVALMNFVLRARRRIAVLAVLGMILAAGVSLVRPRTWSSTASFQPQSNAVGGNLGQLAGLAAQFGVQLPQSDENQSPDFYVALLESRELLTAAGNSAFGAATGGATLARYYEIEAPTAGLAEEKIYKRLRRDVSARADLKTGVITLSVRSRGPELAEALTSRLLELLNDFNLRTRQSQARAERAFAERRLGEVGDSLRAAEDRLQAFLQRNRDFRNSPELTFQQERLARAVALQSQLYQTLATAYEQAKLGEVRDIPVITVVERPTLPARPDGRGLVRRALLGAVIGVLAALLLAFMGALGSTAATAPGADFDELRRLAAEARADWFGLSRRQHDRRDRT